LIIQKIGMIILLAVCAFLGACFPTAFHRSDTPDIWRHIPDAGRAGDINVLVLAISEEYRAGHWASLAKTSGVSRQVYPAIFIPERELKDLSAKLSMHSVDIAFVGVFGSWVEKSNERIVEICVIWPDGRFLALGDPAAGKWERETRGSLTMPWQMQLLETASAAEVLTVLSPLGACPYAGAKLNWDYAMRQRVIAYLRQIAIARSPKSP
jgi:hypothetical protein